ncbi:alpha/beta fold hydrolase [Lutimaribacter marinistellae]|uniref:Alpha/beta fold hydrolase n=1 Tax=Lutimaribacter marinistellae TaxID=1820329 RepID=A0ABV7THN8_9RHOB
MIQMDQNGTTRWISGAFLWPGTTNILWSEDIGGSEIRDETSDRTTVSRDEVIAAIYETVLRPELYEMFMEAWEEHIGAILREPSVAARLDAQDTQGGMEIDPELQAHFARAHDILEQIGRKVPRAELRSRVAQTQGFAILAAPDGRILAAGNEARSAMGEGGTLDDLCTHLTGHGAQMLQSLLKAARDGDAAAHPIVLTTDIRPRHLIARIAIDEGAPVQVVIEGLDYQWTDEAEQMLVTSFGLSRAEVDVVRNLMAGESLRAIAALSGKSEHTVRNQAKSVLAKTGAPGQVELIRLVAYLVDTEVRGRVGHPGKVVLPSENLRMGTGLDMQLYRCGDPRGRPVIYLHGMLDGMAPLQYLQSRFRQRNMRVLAPVRPGYGLSSGVPSPDAAVDAIVAHVRELMDREELEQPVILGHMAGALFGHVLCARLRNQVAGMVAVSGGGPILRMKQISQMAPRQRVMSYTARYAPALLPFFVRAGMALIDSDRIGKLMDTLYLPGSHERRVIDRLGVEELMHAGYRFAVQSGAGGFVSDGHLMVRDWTPQIRGGGASVIHLHGARDPVIPAEATRAFAEVHAHVEFRLRPEAGQFLLYEEPHRVLDAIDELNGKS